MATDTMTPGRRRFLAGLGGLSAWAGNGIAAPAAPGEPVHWPSVELLDGTRWGPAQARGQAVVVVFWSTTCPFCLRHNARLNQLVARAPAGLAILTAARETDAERVRRHAERHGYRFPITLEAQPLAAALSGRRMIPLTVTVDRAGRLAQVIPGEMSEDDILGLARWAG